VLTNTNLSSSETRTLFLSPPITKVLFLEKMSHSAVLPTGSAKPPFAFAMYRLLSLPLTTARSVMYPLPEI
jgi:hypothetical protein